MRRSALTNILAFFVFRLHHASAFLPASPLQDVTLQRAVDETPTFRKHHQPSVNSKLQLGLDQFASTEMLSFLNTFSLNINKDQAEALAGPFFGASLFPYLAFLYFLNVDENSTPKGVTVGFATCLLFVFLTIPAAIASQVLYGVSLADSDWLHGSAESLLTITNLITVVAFRQALDAKEKDLPMPISATSYAPMTWLVVILTALAGVTALVPVVAGADVHTPWCNGFMDLPISFESLGANPEPENGLTIAT